MTSTFVSTIDSIHGRLHQHRSLTEELITSYLDDKDDDDDHDADRHNNVLRLLDF